MARLPRTTVGQPLNAYYGFCDGKVFIKMRQRSNEQLYATDNPTVQPGDIRFKDLDNNGKIDDNDRDFLGSPIP